jgi:hypothetical protein
MTATVVYPGHRARRRRRAAGLTTDVAFPGRRPLVRPRRRAEQELNTRYRFVLLYTVGWDRITAAAADIDQAIQDGAFGVGEQADLPLHRYSLKDVGAAHAAVESGAGGRLGDLAGATPIRRPPL